ncbi:hypothetical protein [Listeria welshimeri]|uniref:hypothetical protein n=1 Tax=Listeria welshimeri TaxID=1643 RepID=UPI0018880331|nr:hypothetical protein [Listeria welshimeri]MBF2450331.1 hypothetical protein [Listeria welshimeri]
MPSKDKNSILGINFWILLFINYVLEKNSTWQSIEEQIAEFLMDELNNLEKEFEQYLFGNAGYSQGEDDQRLLNYFELAREHLLKSLRIVAIKCSTTL